MLNENYEEKKQLIMKRLFYVLWIFSMLFAAVKLSGNDGPKNILFIAIDDLKPLLGSYGEEQMHTPNIDKLAKSGMIFTNAHCQQAVCGPTRASLLTGMRPDYTGVWDLRTKMRHVNEDILTIPEYFRNNGYQTVATGKIYDSRCVDKKYDEPSWSIPYSESSVYTYPEEYGAPALTYYAKQEAKDIVAKYYAEAIEKNIKNVHAYIRERYKPSVECVDVPDDAYMDGQICNNALRYMDEFANSEDPFFLAVGFKRPHLPFAAPKKYWDLYNRDDIQLAPYQQAVDGGVDIAYHNHGELLSYSDIPPLDAFTDIFSNLISEDQQKELIHGYYASVSFIDAQVGKILGKLKELGLDKNTVIVLWGDHGWHLGDHALWCKHSNFEQATRVPLIFSLPGEKGGVYSHPTEFVDIFPTLCEAADLDVPQHLQGQSLMPVFENTKKPLKEFAVSQFDRGTRHGYSLRTNRYRLTVWMKNGYRTFSAFDEDLIYDIELYDYEKDPLETKNCYRTESYKEIADAMMDLFRGFVKGQNEELKTSLSNPENQASSGKVFKLNMDGYFMQEFSKNWMVINKADVDLDVKVLKEGPWGENTLEINIAEDSDKESFIELHTLNYTSIPEGKDVNISFGANGGKIKVVLVSKKGEKVHETIEPANSTYLQRISFKVPATGEWKLKFKFYDSGVHYLHGIKTTIE
jgi:arylsulfatase A-like enzyme